MNEYDEMTLKVMEDIVDADLDEYQVKQLIMFLIAGTLTYDTARKTAEKIVERCSKLKHLVCYSLQVMDNGLRYKLTTKKKQ